MVVAAAQGTWVWDGDGTRYLDFSRQLVNTNIGHQHPRSSPRSRSRRPSSRTVAPQHANDAAQRGGPADRRAGARATASTTCSSPTAAPRRSRTPSGWPGCTPAGARCSRRYRSYHGNTTTAINLTGDPRRWPNDYGAEGVVHFFGPFLYRSAFHADDGARRSASGRWSTSSRSIALEGPPTIAAIVLESIPGTAGHHDPAAGLPRRRPRALRPATASAGSPTR